MPVRHTVIPRAMCLVFYKDEVLLIKASDEKEWSGIYNPIGGHIEKGESIIESAKREIKEESGINPLNIKLKGIIHVTNFFSKDIMMFITSSIVKTKKLLYQHDEGKLEWVKLTNLTKIKIFEDVKPIIDRVLKMKTGEIFVGTSEFDGKDRLLALDIKI